MNLPPQLLPILRRFEGLHRVGKDGLIYPYVCPAGFATQGYGSLVKDMSVPPITRAEAEARLVIAAEEHLRHAIRLSPGLVNEPDYRLAAIGSFVFNLGPGKYQASTLRKRVNAKDWERAYTELQKWIWGGGKKLPGLVLRRVAEGNLLLGRVV